MLLTEAAAAAAAAAAEAAAQAAAAAEAAAQAAAAAAAEKEKEKANEAPPGEAVRAENKTSEQVLEKMETDSAAPIPTGTDSSALPPQSVS